MGRNRGGAGRGARGGAGAPVDEEARYGPPGIVAGTGRNITPGQLGESGVRGLESALQNRMVMNAIPARTVLRPDGNFIVQVNSTLPRADIANRVGREMGAVVGRRNVTITRTASSRPTYPGDRSTVTVQGNLSVSPSVARRFS